MRKRVKSVKEETYGIGMEGRRVEVVGGAIEIVCSCCLHARNRALGRMRTGVSGGGGERV